MGSTGMKDAAIPRSGTDFFGDADQGEPDAQRGEMPSFDSPPESKRPGKTYGIEDPVEPEIPKLEWTKEDEERHGKRPSADVADEEDGGISKSLLARAAAVGIEEEDAKDYSAKALGRTVSLLEKRTLEHGKGLLNQPKPTPDKAGKTESQSDDSVDTSAKFEKVTLSKAIEDNLEPEFADAIKNVVDQFNTQLERISHQSKATFDFVEGEANARNLRQFDKAVKALDMPDLFGKGQTLSFSEQSPFLAARIRLSNTAKIIRGSMRANGSNPTMKNAVRIAAHAEFEEELAKRNHNSAREEIANKAKDSEKRLTGRPTHRRTPPAPTDPRAKAEQEIAKKLEIQRRRGNLE